MRLHLFLYSFFLLFNVSGALTAQIFDWTVPMGTPLGSDVPSSMMTDPDGNVYLAVAGTASDLHIGNYTFPNSGNSTLFLMKFDPLGNLLWVLDAPGSRTQTGLVWAGNNTFYLAATARPAFSMGGLSLGNGYNDYVLIKFDGDGNALAHKSIPSPSDDGAYDVDVDAQGNVYMTGYFRSAITFDSLTWLQPVGVQQTSFLVKFDDSLDVIWAHRLAADYDLNAFKLSVDALGNVFVSGGFTGDSVMMVNDTTTKPSMNGIHSFTARFDTSGNHHWTQLVYGPNWDVIEGNAADELGNIYIVGGYRDEVFIGGQHLDPAATDYLGFVAAYDSAGSLFLLDTLTGWQGGYLWDIKNRNPGEMFLTGQISRGSQFMGQTPTFNPYQVYFLAQIDSSGSLGMFLTGDAPPGGGNFSNGRSLALDPDGNILMAGRIVGPSIFGPDTISIVGGGDDVFLSRIQGEVNKITGSVFVDVNTNGIFDAGEAPYTAGLLQTKPGPEYFNLMTDGTFLVYSDSGNVVLKPLPLPLYHAAVPDSAVISFNGYNLSDTGNHFAIQPIPNIQDLEVTLIPATPFRPGFVGRFRITARNIGTTTVTPSVNFTFDPSFTFDSALPAISSQSGNMLTWNLSSLQPGTQQEIDVWFTVPINTPLGTQTFQKAVLSPQLSDTTPANNEDSLWVTVTGSYDPNDKLVRPEEIIDPLEASGPFEYTVRFQNTGTDTAFRVLIADQLDPLLDPGTLEIITASHPYSWQISPSRTLTFRFDNILLPDSNTNEPASHGLVTFRLKSFSPLAPGDTIQNKAEIYFDFNSPIFTNEIATHWGSLYATLAITQPITCPGFMDAEIKVTEIAGLTGGLLFSLDSLTWQTDSTFTNLGAGTYRVYIKDSFGGEVSTNLVSIVEPTVLGVDLGNDTLLCPASSLQLSPGTGPGSTYLWSDNSTDSTLLVTAGGQYWVTVVSSAGCSATDTLVITQVTPPALALGADTGYCQNSSLALAASPGFTTYLWSTGGSSANLTVSQPGLYWVMGTLSGCESTDTVQVTEYPLPIITNLDPQYLLCPGESITLDPGIGYASYLWSDNSTDSTLLVNAGGQYWVRVVSAAGCPITDTALITQVTPPVLTLGADTGYCQNSSLVLTASLGFTSYLWSTGDTSANLTVNQPGSFWVAATFSGCELTDTVQVTENPLPIITNLDPQYLLCPGESVTLDPGAGYTSYLWSNGATTQTINISASDSFWVSVTDSNGCSGSDTLQVELLIGPAASFTYSGSGNSFQFTDQSSSAQSWAWDFGEGGVSSAQHPSYSYASSGNYLVCLAVTDSAGCIDEFCDTLSFISSREIQITSENNQMLIYPNPTENRVQIEWKGSSQNHLEVVVSDLKGTRVKTMKLPLESGKAFFHTADLSEGVYLLEFPGTGQLPIRLGVLRP